MSRYHPIFDQLALGSVRPPYIPPSLDSDRRSLRAFYENLAPAFRNAAQDPFPFGMGAGKTMLHLGSGGMIVLMHHLRKHGLIIVEERTLQQQIRVQLVRALQRLRPRTDYSEGPQSR